MEKNKDKKYYIFSLDMNFLNIFSFILLFLIIILTLIIDGEFLIDSINYTFSMERLFVTFIFIFLYLILHELFHGIGYYLYGAKYKNIIYGIELEKGIFYCLCKQNIKKKNILNSLMFPLFYIGLVTYIFSFIINNQYLLILSIFNISGCIGDIFTFMFMIKLDNDIEFSEFDDTTSFAIYSENNISNIRHLGLKYMGVKNNIVRNDYRKIRISTFSYIILILVIFMLLFI